MAQWRSSDAPADSLKRELALASLDYYLDVNVLTEKSAAMTALRRARQEGWLRLQRTDVMDTELAGASPEKRSALLAESATYVESLGPWVGGHSRGDHMIGGSPADAARFQQVFEILKPGLTSPADGTSNDIRDAMHVSNAIRYAASGFITRDRNILRRAESLAALTPSAFAVLPPEDALAELKDAVRRAVTRHKMMNSTAWLPDWRP